MKEQENERQHETKAAEEEQSLTAGVNRRHFLRGLLAASGAGLLAACAPGNPATRPFAAQYATATAARVLASPRAATPEPEAATPTDPAQGQFSLEQFLALSTVLTGVENLDPVVGRVYLNSLQASDEFDVTLGDLYQQAGFESASPPTAIAGLEEAGIFESDATATLADKIIEYWYTGVYTTADGQQAVATYVDALAWKALLFTKPNSICASPGFWEKRPEVTIPRE